ncbi:MAG: SpoIVB peptidase [Oscillospiraceae bacterium]|nr:SpoIVB peptidase [Oscillospiraceae bacterium]
MKKIMKFLTVTAAVTGLLFAAVLGTANYFTPDSYTVAEGGSLKWCSGAFSLMRDGKKNVSVSAGGRFPKTYQATLMLCNAIPVKTVRVNVVDKTCVVLSGKPFGIKMFTNGVVVVGLADIQTESGVCNPASDAGLCVGDVITAIDGKTMESNIDVEKAVEASNGDAEVFTVRENGQKRDITVQPARSETDGLYKVGLWVRDSTAGIGTLTYYDPSTGYFAGLGHGICDSDTGQLMPLLSGDIVSVAINGITKGQRGTPGELHGYFSSDNAMGSLSANVACGVFGRLNRSIQGTAVKIGMKQDVKPGAVKILTTIQGSAPQYYDAQIERINYRDDVQSKNIVLHVTDPKLLSQTGGIVQGMSGSPIVQNGRLVGAVTHVFVNDPERGYGIFAEKMLMETRSVSARGKRLAS